MLTIENLNKKSKDKHILKDVTFQVSRGSVGLFLGGSGVGKSTVFRVLNHLESYDSGMFALDGQTLDLKTVGRNHVVGMVFQHFNLFEHLSVEDNIILPLVKLKKRTRGDAKLIAKQLLEKYGLEEKGKSRVQQLSGGQKQRLAIARTLALDPQVVCMDEPTSALDPLLASQVADDIAEIAKSGRVVLVSAHDIRLIEMLDATAFYMHAGTIAESIPLRDYKAKPELSPMLRAFLKGH